VIFLGWLIGSLRQILIPGVYGPYSTCEEIWKWVPSLLWDLQQFLWTLCGSESGPFNTVILNNLFINFYLFIYLYSAFHNTWLCTWWLCPCNVHISEMYSSKIIQILMYLFRPKKIIIITSSYDHMIWKSGSCVCWLRFGVIWSPCSGWHRLFTGVVIESTASQQN